MKDFFRDASMQNHPLRALKHFLDQEAQNEAAKKYEALRFVGYVLEIGFDTVTIITSDPFKVAVGGVPRNSLLIMVPATTKEDDLPLHFTLLRVLESAPTPLSQEVQHTYFELQKKSMPELDVFTQSELQWGALKTSILGMFYPHPEHDDAVEFSGDINNFVSAHKYRVYAPTDDILDLIMNCLVPADGKFEIGKLRLTECRLPLPNKPQPDVPVCISRKDFMATRTAMFGKTRLGKSNVVKLIAESLLQTAYNKHAMLLVSPNAIAAMRAQKVPDHIVTYMEGQLQRAVTGLQNFRDTVLASLSPSDIQTWGIKIADCCRIKVGQLIFDINGEYANDNPQDSSYSLKSAYAERCEVYALTPKDSTPSKPLKLNFYEQPDSAHRILASLLANDNLTSGYVRVFASVELPSIKEVESLDKMGDKIRALRKLQMFWAILAKAKYNVDEAQLKALIPSTPHTHNYDPGFSGKLREAVYGAGNVPEDPKTLADLVSELERVNAFRRDNASHATLKSDKDPLSDADDIALLEFLAPQQGRSGVSLLQPYRQYHDSKASDFMKDILELMDQGRTVILDLSNANQQVMEYFSDRLSREVFAHQSTKFSNNRLGSTYIQLYFEEAHNLFPSGQDVTTIYNRFAKEGAKYHVGMVYSTQSPTTISKDLLAQTDNFFVAHLSSQEEANSLGKLNFAYSTLAADILQARTPGYIRMLTRSHRFVVPVQARKFEPPKRPDGQKQE